MADWESIVADLRATEDDAPRAVAACEALERMADESMLPDLHRLLTDEDFFVREAAALPIARLEGLRALPDLLRAKQRGADEGQDNDGLNRVVVDLVTSAPEKAALQLLGMLIDGSEQIRSVSAWLLGFVSDQVGHEQLLEALRDRSATVRAEAAGALSSFVAHAEVFDGLVRALDADADEQVRVSAAAALGDCGDERALTALRKALSDPAERVRQVARYGIDKLEGSP